MDQLIGLIAGHTTTDRSEGFVVDKVLDKTGMKGTGRWTVQEGAERSVPVSTMTAALDARYLSARKDEVSKQASKQARTATALLPMRLPPLLFPPLLFLPQIRTVFSCVFSFLTFRPSSFSSPSSLTFFYFLIL